MNRAVQLLLGLSAGWCLLYLLHTLGIEWVPVGDVKTIHLLVMGVGALLCLARAVHQRAERAAWALIGLAFLSWIGGDIYFTSVLWDQSQPPIPSWADAGYLSMPPLLFAGLLLLLRSRIRALPRTLWVDGITAALAVSSVSAAVVVQAVLSTAAGGRLAIVTNLAYPLADLVLLGIIAGGLAAGSWRLDRVFGLMVIGVVMFWLADSVYLVRVAQGTWVSGGPSELGWWMAALLFAAAAWQRGGHTGVPTRQRGAVVIAMPTAFATVALGVLVTGSLGTLNPIAVVLATASLAAVMLRLVLTFEQHGRTLNTLRHQAHHDALTGLANRTLLEERLRHALARGHRRRGRAAVLLLDLDEFKTINDSLGHGAGDALLAVIAGRLSDGLRSGDTVARLGGDEFAIVLEDPGDLEAVTDLAQRLLSAIAEPVPLSGRQIHPHASIGIALTDALQPGPHDEVAEADELLRGADIAMYAAKAEGKNRSAVFAAHMHAAALERLERRAELQQALDRDELRLHFQPIVDLQTGDVEGAEALVRWQHPTRGLLGPGEFIALAEETNLIIPLGAWVLREACRQAARWREEFPGDPDRYISVNVAGHQLQSPEFLDEVRDALDAADLPSDCLMLEVTESCLLEDTQTNSRRLQALRALGVRLALDDFGTGYSALNYLRRFRMDVLKIDRSFIEGVESPSEQSALVDAILAMAGALDLRVVAEGIEHGPQLQHLRDRACPLGQGFLFSRPLPAVELTALLAGRRRALPAAAG
jgi:diguanylate cyclase (GGDEF)-like protein